MAQGYVRVWSGSLSYIGTINRINALGTILLTVHAGTLDKVNRVGTVVHGSSEARLVSRRKQKFNLFHAIEYSIAF